MRIGVSMGMRSGANRSERGACRRNDESCEVSIFIDDFPDLQSQLPIENQ